jgi:hypothetical protein
MFAVCDSYTVLLRLVVNFMILAISIPLHACLCNLPARFRIMFRTVIKTPVKGAAHYDAGTRAFCTAMSTSLRLNPGARPKQTPCCIIPMVIVSCMLNQAPTMSKQLHSHPQAYAERRWLSGCCDNLLLLLKENLTYHQSTGQPLPMQVSSSFALALPPPHP